MKRKNVVINMNHKEKDLVICPTCDKIIKKKFGTNFN